MENNNRVMVTVSVASLYLEPTFTSELVTQALKGEDLVVLDYKNKWLKVKQWDDYISWIHDSYIEEYNSQFLNNNIKENQVLMSMNEMIEYGHSLIGTPYLWGGKSKLGFDCSGFIQTLLRLIGIKFPRDCSQQIKYINMKKIDLENSDIGDLIFFKENKSISHIGIFVNSNGCFLHCSGEVKINSINSKNKVYYSNKLELLFHSIYRIENDT